MKNRENRAESIRVGMNGKVSASCHSSLFKLQFDFLSEFSDVPSYFIQCY